MFNFIVTATRKPAFSVLPIPAPTTTTTFSNNLITSKYHINQIKWSKYMTSNNYNIFMIAQIKEKTVRF